MAAIILPIVTAINTTFYFHLRRSHNIKTFFQLYFTGLVCYKKINIIQLEKVSHKFFAI